MRARRPLHFWTWEALHSWGRSSVLPQTPNHRPPIAGEELYSTRLALNHCCRGEVICPPLLSNGGLSSLTNGGNACRRGAGRPASCLPILFISAQGSFEGFGIGPGLRAVRCLRSMLLPPHTYKDLESSPQMLTQALGDAKRQHVEVFQGAASLSSANQYTFLRGPNATVITGRIHLATVLGDDWAC